MNLKLKNKKVFDSTYYDESYFTKEGCKGWYDEHAFKLTQIFHKNWAEFVIYNLKIKANDNLLDIGCARANAVYWWTQRLINAYGVDISKWAIKNAHISTCMELDITKGFEPLRKKIM